MKKQTIPIQLPDEFTNCSDLPLSRFIKITVTGDLSYLGRCTDPEKLWENIHSEYTELSGDGNSNRGLELAKQITFLTNKINITAQIVTYMEQRGNVPELIQELKNMGYRLQYTDLAGDLKRTLSLSKSDQVKLAAYSAEYEKMQDGTSTTEPDWYKMLAALAKHRGVTVINPSQITVVEYIVMDLEFRAYVGIMSKK